MDKHKDEACLICEKLLNAANYLDQQLVEMRYIRGIGKPREDGSWDPYTKEERELLKPLSEYSKLI